MEAVKFDNVDHDRFNGIHCQIFISVTKPIKGIRLGEWSGVAKFKTKRQYKKAVNKFTSKMASNIPVRIIQRNADTEIKLEGNVYPVTWVEKEKEVKFVGAGEPIFKL